MSIGVGQGVSGSVNRQALTSWVRAIGYKQTLENGPHPTLLSVVAEQAGSRGDSPALCDETRQLSYQELVQLSGAFAQWTLEQGPGRAETVCVMMPNSVAYVAAWLGITHTGRIAALINTNLSGAVLAHSVRISGARHVLVDASMQATVSAIAEQIPGQLNVWVYNGHSLGADGSVHILQDSTAAGVTTNLSVVPPDRHDKALLIYTSGTTGVPKGAYVSHARILEWSAWFAGMMDAQPTDRLYNCLPMYHSVGGVVAVGSMLVRGGAVVVRSRFSASRFWDDVVAHDCTIFQYIGELCRYLVDSPAHKSETSHRLRLCCGNGLRGGVWEEFQARFQIPRVLEFYAATEGNVSLYNCEGKPGAIGRIPPVLASSYPIELIRIDTETGSPVRGPDGLCIRCRHDEAGEAISPIIPDSQSAARRFHGYTDAVASQQKMLRDVFTFGDCWFRSGDLLRKDKAGYYYYIDRLGDTFRWKGENVSTQEVASIITSCPGVADAVVYGVKVPGTEGRAGMAAIATTDGFSLHALRRHLVTQLPDYARPLFVRVCQNIEVTSTFKPTKARLIRDGLAASEPDTLWFNDSGSQAFVPLGPELLCKINEGVLRL